MKKESSIRLNIRKYILSHPKIYTLFKLVREKEISKKYSVIPVTNIKPSNQIEILEIDKSEIIENYLPTFVGEESKTSNNQLDPIRLLKIKNGIALGESNIIILNKETAIYNHAYGNNVNVTDKAIQDAIQDFSFKYKLGKIKIWKRIKRRKKLDQAISLLTNYSNNYYHFLFECLAKFYYYEKLQLDKNIPLLVDYTIKNIPQFQDLLLKINQNKFPIIYVKRKEQVKVKNMICLSPLHYIPANYLDINKFENNQMIFNTNIIGYLRDKIGSNKINNNKNTKFKIFISRKGNKNRNYNETEIQKILVSQNFIVIHPEDLSIEQQIYYFNSASVIVGASGAALSNLIFCNRDAKILILIREGIRFPIFSPLAQPLNLNIKYLAGKASDPNDLHSSFNINPNSLKSALLTL